MQIAEIEFIRLLIRKIVATMPLTKDEFVFVRYFAIRFAEAFAIHFVEAWQFDLPSNSAPDASKSIYYFITQSKFRIISQTKTFSNFHINSKSKLLFTFASKASFSRFRSKLRARRGGETLSSHSLS